MLLSKDYFARINQTISEQRQLLEMCAATALSSKLVAGQKDFFSKLVVDAVKSLDSHLPINMIGIKKVGVSFSNIVLGCWWCT